MSLWSRLFGAPPEPAPAPESEPPKPGHGIAWFVNEDGQFQIVCSPEQSYRHMHMITLPITLTRAQSLAIARAVLETQGIDPKDFR